MITVVVTGGIGSGKSLFCRLLAEKGISVYDSDSMVKYLYDNDMNLLSELVSCFGDRILTEGKLDRKYMASLVFSDSAALHKLESIVHPALFRHFRKWKADRAAEKYIVYESAITLEKELPEGLFDLIVYVDSDLETRLERAVKRDVSDREQILRRISCQKADATDPRIGIVIENNGTEEQLRLKADWLHDKILNEYI